MSRNIVLSSIFFFFVSSFLYATFVEVENEPITLKKAAPKYVEVDKEPIAIKKVEPKYPEIARKEKIEGQVVVAVLIDVDGKSRDARVVKTTNEIFNDAAVEAAKQWLFSPAVLNKKPVKFWFHVPIDFKLRKRRSFNAVTERKGVLPNDSSAIHVESPENKAEGAIEVNPSQYDHHFGEPLPIDEEPFLIHRVEPNYPPIAYVNKVEGQVVVRILIGTTGKVDSAVVAHSSNEIFNKPALEAAKRWTFKPATYNKKPVKWWYDVPIDFKIR